MQYQKKETLLSAKGVGIAFKQESKPDKVIFKDINFEIHDIIRPNVVTGQVVALVGRSGIGKSTMIRMLAGLYIPGSVQTGSILVDAAQKPVKPGDMGVVAQNYYLPAHLKLKEILFLAAAKNKAFKGDHKLMLDAITSYLIDFELAEHRDKYFCQMSGGQKQRTAITCQLLYGANFLLLDEPFSGLDPLMVDKTTDLLLRVSRIDEVKTIIIISHDLRNCVALSDTVLILSNAGRKPEDGATIVKTIDLMQIDLAWQPRIKEMPLFLDVIRDIKNVL